MRKPLAYLNNVKKKTNMVQTIYLNNVLQAPDLRQAQGNIFGTP